MEPESNWIPPQDIISFTSLLKDKNLYLATLEFLYLINNIIYFVYCRFSKPYKIDESNPNNNNDNLISESLENNEEDKEDEFKNKTQVDKENFLINFTDDLSLYLFETKYYSNFSKFQ